MPSSRRSRVHVDPGLMHIDQHRRWNESSQRVVRPASHTRKDFSNFLAFGFFNLDAMTIDHRLE